jgi:hypothetical protein
MKRLAIEWTKHLPEDKRGHFEQTIRNSWIVLDRLRMIIEERESEIQRKMSSPDFSHGSWSHENAFSLGQLNQLKKLKDLISIEKDSK